MIKNKWNLSVCSHFTFNHFIYLLCWFTVFLFLSSSPIHSQVLTGKIYSPNLHPVSLHVYNTGRKYVVIDSTGYLLIYNMSELTLSKKLTLTAGISMCNDNIAVIDEALGKMYILGSTGTTVIDLAGETILNTLPIYASGLMTVLRGKLLGNESLGLVYVYTNHLADPTLYRIHVENDQIDSFPINSANMYSSVANMNIIQDMTIDPVKNLVYFC
jgi:hypothetical protein